MSKSNFSKAMKELIGINDEDLEKNTDGGGEDIASNNPLETSLFGKEGRADLGVEPLDLTEGSDFDKERDDASAKLRMMLNKDKESDKKETPTSSFADKFSKMSEIEYKEESALDEKASSNSNFGQVAEAPVGVTPKVSQALASVSKTVDNNISSEDAKTVIGKGVVITGNLTAQGDIEVNGIIKGDIKTSGNVKVKGKIAGDIGGTDLDLIEGGAVQGDILARGTASIDKGSVIIGDVTAGNINLNGKVKGNLAARDVADLSDSSVIDGNISAASVAINPGTKLRGQISLTSASDVSDEDFIIDFDS